MAALCGAFWAFAQGLPKRNISPLTNSSAQAKRRDFCEMLDTGASLCCSVRQRRLQFKPWAHKAGRLW